MNSIRSFTGKSLRWKKTNFKIYFLNFFDQLKAETDFFLLQVKILSI